MKVVILKDRKLRLNLEQGKNMRNQEQLLRKRKTTNRPTRLMTCLRNHQEIGQIHSKKGDKDDKGNKINTTKIIRAMLMKKEIST